MVDTWTSYGLGNGSELRFSVSGGGRCKVRLDEGVAEIFGSPLVEGQLYEVQGPSRLSVFTWTGARVSLSGASESVEVSATTSMTTAMGIHLDLEEARAAARAGNHMGPVCFIVGPMDAGKSTLTRVLANYAVSDPEGGRRVTVVDLDLGMQGLAVPGCVSAYQQSTTQPFDNPMPVTPATLALFFGHTSPSADVELYRRTCQALYEYVQRKLEKTPELLHQGVIVNTCGWVDSESARALLKSLIGSFKANRIIVLGDRALHDELGSVAWQKSEKIEATITMLDRLEGAAKRESSARGAIRSERFRTYFHGHDNKLLPHMVTTSYGGLNLLRIMSKEAHDGKGPAGERATEACPVRSATNRDKAVYLVIEPTPALVGHVLAVVHTPAQAPLEKCAAAGFVVVTAIDTEAKTITFLSPSPGELPSNTLTKGSTSWQQA
jgi:polyribonucleotide 5'-hydroxyl-kinase